MCFLSPQYKTSTVLCPREETAKEMAQLAFQIMKTLNTDTQEIRKLTNTNKYLRKQLTEQLHTNTKHKNKIKNLETQMEKLTDMFQNNVQDAADAILAFAKDGKSRYALICSHSC